MTTSRSPLRLLLLFQGMWEEQCVRALRAEVGVELHREGFDWTQWGGLLRLWTLDAERWFERLCDRYRGRIDAVWSSDDQLGTLLAARMAQRLGLPGADPAAVVRTQHKLLLRRTLAGTLPEATVRSEALPWPLRDRRCRSVDAVASAVAGLGLTWPRFCKPVKASFSVLARRVANAEELAGHLRLPWIDRWLLARLDRPWQQLAERVLPLPCSVDRALLEEPLAGRQVNVDGYAFRGAVHALGVVDECMYPGEVQGARHFAGFTFPSRLPPVVQERVRAVATAAVRALGYDHGLFNVELFVGDDGSVKVIEVNPRAAGQFATMYRAVAGIDLQRLAIDLALGREPSLQSTAPTAAVAASFVFRRFDGRPGVEPDAAARAWLAATFPDSPLWTEPCSARALRREYRWLGSHRHAVWNHAAADFDTLFADGERVARRLFGCGAPEGVR
jgi:hypothetical protein